MELFKSLAKLPSWQRLLIIVAIGVVLIAVSLFTDISSKNQVASIPPLASSYTPNNSATSNRPIMPNGNLNTITRDPFSLPPDMINSNVGKDLPKTPNDRNPSMSPNSISSKTSVTKSSNENYRLTGIAGTNSTRVAVISSGNGSKAYQINEKIGSYTISTISEDSLTLIGPGGQRTLRLETASPKGGEKNSK